VGIKSTNESIKKTLATTSYIQRTLTINEPTISSYQDTIQNLNTISTNKIKRSTTSLTGYIAVQKAIDENHQKNERNYKLIRQARIKETMLREERRERYDNIHEAAFQEAKQRGFIRDFLKTKDSRIIREGLLDEFYNKKENYINFKSDCLLVPNIRNHMVNRCKNFDERIQLLTNPNSIDLNTQLYLNLLKRKCQKAKDDKIKTEEKNSKKDIIDLKIEDVYRRIYGHVPKLVNIDTYDYNDYLLYKYDRYDKVGFASKEIKDIIATALKTPINVDKM
jgi:hypothetical protein